MKAVHRKIFGQAYEAFQIALQLVAIRYRWFQLVYRARRSEIETPLGAGAESRQLFVRNVRQSRDAVVKTTPGKPCSLILDVNVVPLFGFDAVDDRIHSSLAAGALLKSASRPFLIARPAAVASQI